MKRPPRFEIVRTDAGWHSRFRAGNGQIVWTTEVYTRRKPAQNAVVLMTWNMGSWGEVSEVRDVDERTTQAAGGRG